MDPRQERLNQAFVAQSPLHASIWEVLCEVAPHWNPQLSRRFGQALIEGWREHALKRPRALQFLTIALRLGWFDDQASTTRWTFFLDLIAQIDQAISAAGAVNLFNLCAALPAEVVLGEVALDDRLRRALHLTRDTARARQADAATITDCVRLLCAPRGAGIGLTQESGLNEAYFHLIDGQVISQRGRAWAEIDWRARGLSPRALMEPFGKDPFVMVSDVGLVGEELMAYCKPRHLTVSIDIHALRSFSPTLSSIEPVFAKPTFTLDGGPWLTTLFVLAHDLAAGITRDGALALFERGAEP